ncbi:G/U mismatch-specific DNA glycosylase [Rhizobium tumorigenes]|uniref:G/U mismatch-specific DNA glycosylase n=1 Tax=Rhizobium tumorigenes TaxID=2041385 RepID=UPI00241F1117|nr:G/U mismatch-specific DNA glycosylase [Rhizobium tumorigenes]WFS03650.1 G/U mismatch-specific DNA glycosylase [Rhizobium tumorigenes]
MNGPSDILTSGLNVVFCGLNPALSAAREGHNFSSPSNRFWRVLHRAGFTPRQLRADEEWKILDYGLGITAAVMRPTKSASELTRCDYVAAGPALERKIRSFAPNNVAFLGKAAYAAIGLKRHIEWGKQPESLAGAAIWVLPNPSGLNRAFNLESLTAHYRQLQVACGRP